MAEVTKSLSNLLKSYAVVCSHEEKRVIDSNEAISYAMDKIKEHMENTSLDEFKSSNGFTQGLNAEDVSELLYSESDDSGEKILSGNAIHNEPEISEKMKEHIEEIKNNAEESARMIIDNAKGDANAIIESARKQAEQIMEDARKEGYESGFNDGIKDAQQNIVTRLSEIDEEKKKLEEEYELRKKEMEPQLVDAILQVFSKVTHVLSEDKKDLILSLVDGVINDNKLSNNFLIRTSKEDGEFLKNNKDKIVMESGKELNIEIVEDNSMKRNECIIETDMGIFDCSLDIQLQGLIKDIKLLACAVEK